MVFQNISINTVGFYNASNSNTSRRDAFKHIFSMPTVYAVPLALLFKLIPVDLAQIFFWPALTMASNALIGVANRTWRAVNQNQV